MAFADAPAAPLVETFPCVSKTSLRRFALAVIPIAHGSGYVRWLELPGFQRFSPA